MQMVRHHSTKHLISQPYTNVLIVYCLLTSYLPFSLKCSKLVLFDTKFAFLSLEALRINNDSP